MTVYSTIIRGRVLNETRRSRNDDRLPEDSGEWTAVPRQFTRLSEPHFEYGRQLGHGRLRTAATLLPFIQLAIGLGILYLSCGTGCPLDWVLMVPVLIGFFSSLVATCVAVSGTEFRVGNALIDVLRGQLWWLLLLLVPCYGWALLIVCVPMCLLGTIAGTLFGANLQSMDGHAPKGSSHGDT